MQKLRGTNKIKRGWAFYYKRIDREFSVLVREKGYCEWCGSVDNQLQHAHVIGRANKFLRWDIMNAMCLCSYCHQYRWHENPLIAQKWFKEKFPGRYIYLMEARGRTVDRFEEDYLRIRSDIKNKNIKNLIMAPDLLT